MLRRGTIGSVVLRFSRLDIAHAVAARYERPLWWQPTNGRSTYMGEKGKAAVFLGPGKGYEMQEFDVPDPEPEAIVIKVSMGGICGSDLHIWRGDSPVFAAMAGNVVGHEMTGRVYKLGKNISTDSLGQPLKEGDRVCYAYFYPCYRCYHCSKQQ